MLPALLVAAACWFEFGSPVAQAGRTGYDLCSTDRAGTGGADELIGGAAGEELSGGDGDDLVDGRAGPDCVFGDDGDDRVLGGTGNDLAYGGEGRDRVDGGSGSDLEVSGGPGADAVGGGTGDDVVLGRDGDDRVTGGAGNDSVYGDDPSYHVEESDLLSTGDDVLDGGAGDDLLDGGPGRNRLTAGAGDDALLAADGFATTVDCGAGFDQAIVDPGDRPVGCERVERERSPYLTVTPGRGGPTTRFEASLLPVDDGGSLYIDGRGPRKECRVGGTVRYRSDGRAHAVLRPMRGTRRASSWCRGRYEVWILIDYGEEEPYTGPVYGLGLAEFVVR